MSDQTFGGYEHDINTTSLGKAPANTGISLFDELLEEAKKPQDFTETFNVKGRDGFTITFDLDFGSRDIRRWNKLGQGRRKSTSDADQRIICGAMLVEQNTGIFKDGQQIMAPNGEELTFGHKAFIDAFTKDMFVKTATDAVMSFLGEGQAFSLCDALTELAGFGDKVDPLDAPVDPING